MTDSDVRLKILVLHRLGDPVRWRKAVRDLEYLLPDHAPNHDFIVHAAEQPLPEFVRNVKFHAIILGPTFLCARFTPHAFARVLEDYDFVRSADAVKIALPQDEYDCSALLDRWMIDWSVDAVYAVCDEHWPVLYPEYSKTGRLRLGYTGYIADAWLHRFSRPRPRADRSIDVSYRARDLPPNYGRLGRIKSEIGRAFMAQPVVRGLSLDISTDDAAIVAGPDWHDFLENSKFCLATNSGSSLIDPHGKIRACVERHAINHPAATFDEIEAACFPGLDGQFNFTAISPRHLEAALAATVQIATPGRYSSILEPGRHCILTEPDCANAVDVVRQMRDQALVDRMARDAREAVLDVAALRASNQAAALIELIKNGVGAKRISATPEGEMKRAIERYHAEVTANADAYWRRQRGRQRLRDLAVALGARKIKRWWMRTA